MWGISSPLGPLYSTAGMASEKIGTHLALFSPLRDLGPRAQLEKQKHRERRIIKVLFFTTSPRDTQERKKKKKRKKKEEKKGKKEREEEARISVLGAGQRGELGI